MAVYPSVTNTPLMDERGRFSKTLPTYIEIKDWLRAIPNDHFIHFKQSFKTDDIGEMAKTTTTIFTLRVASGARMLQWD
ncbi:MAG: hypothetical protein RIC80_03140 [Cyclobacteriaceae bacterium]